MKKANYLDVYAIAEGKYGPEKAKDILKAKGKANKGFEQPLPDIIGFKQHGGECANDSLQEILLFADGIREYTQPIVYGYTMDQIELRTKMNLEYDDWSRFQEYFEYIQKRFRHHYDAIKYLKEHSIKAQKYYNETDDMCDMNPLFKVKRHASFEAGILAVKRIKEEDKYTGTGLSSNQVQEIATNVIKCLDIPYSSEHALDRSAVGIALFAYYIKVISDSSLKSSSLGHSISFIKVLDSWVYYDDNLGFIKVDDLVIEALLEKRLLIVIYKKVYFALKETSDSTIIESIWSEGAWSSSAKQVLYNDKGLIPGIYIYNPHHYVSIVPKARPSLNQSYCNIQAQDLKPSNTEQLLATMGKFRACIYANLSSNSKTFENLYHFLCDSFDLVKREPETFDFVQKTISTVVLRPACTPMTHYWCSQIQAKLKGIPNNTMSWFEIPALKAIHVPVLVNTPQDVLDKRIEAYKKMAEKEREKAKLDEVKLPTPCPPGQVRNAKTKKCRDRKKREPKVKEDPNKPISNKNKPNKPEKTRKSRCPKGEVRDKKTGLCVKRQEPCPPGEVRDKKTKECKPRLEPCPPGQIMDPKTKECRDLALYKF